MEAVTEQPDTPCSLEGRFGFGENWRSFLQVLDEPRIAESEAALKALLRLPDLTGRRFLDIGSGSGLSSLSARRLGASVRSFDFDPSSVWCTTQLRKRFYPDDPDWTVSQGDVLDESFLATLGHFDVVYSWGVLHHTGDMWAALDRVDGLVAPQGTLCLALYNDQGSYSRVWKTVKRTYNLLPRFLQLPYALLVYAPLELRHILHCTLTLQLGGYFRRLLQGRSARGMNRWHDIVDWVGGWPFEVAKPEEVFRFFRDRGYALEDLTTCGGGLGCNQYLFRKTDDRK
ncbi:MAG: class I SAM-dependent methyltransferase [Candidatus Wallbacteria bacterium]|nr:class I SAM-dependent methyltransferase [Candidatus Wallbacteria bacterium]